MDREEFVVRDRSETKEISEKLKKSDCRRDIKKYSVTELWAWSPPHVRCIFHSMADKAPLYGQHLCGREQLEALQNFQPIIGFTVLPRPAAVIILIVAVHPSLLLFSTPRLQVLWYCHSKGMKWRNSFHAAGLC